MSKTSYLFRTFRVKAIAALKAIDSDPKMSSDDALRLSLLIGLAVQTPEDIATVREGALEASFGLGAAMLPSTQFALQSLCAAGRVQ